MFPEMTGKIPVTPFAQPVILIILQGF